MLSLGQDNVGMRAFTLIKSLILLHIVVQWPKVVSS
jgi:hypothetical protein